MLGRGIREIFSNTKKQNILKYRPFSIVNQTSNDVKCCLSGFSMYSSRKDLELLLGSYQPKSIDPLLKPKTLDFFGAYNLEFNTAQDLTAFKSELSKRNELNTYKLGQPLIDNKRYLQASHFNITNKTVKCFTDKIILEDHLLFLFEDYKLSRKSIQRIEMKDTEFSKFLLHFRSPEEAELAFVVKNLKLVLGNYINLSVYQC